MKSREIKCVDLVRDCIAIGATKEFLKQLKSRTESELRHQREVELAKLENDIKLIKDELDLS